MRKIVWTGLTLSLFVGGIVVSSSIPFSEAETVAVTAVTPLAPGAATPAPTPQAATLAPDEARASTSPLAASDRQANGSRSTAPGADPADEAEAVFDLDRADPSVVRRVLREAIDEQQRTRALYVSPGIVETLADQGHVRVIFETGSGLSGEQVHALLAGAGKSASVDGLRLFPLLDQGAATLSPQALLHLVRFEGTAHIELDVVHRPSLTETVALIGADVAHQQGYDGDGAVVAVLDTGVDTSHPMLAGRVLEQACFSFGLDCPNGQLQMFGAGAAAPCGLPGCGHGTHVAGVAVAGDTGNGLVGTAPNAGLIAIQIFSEVAGTPGAYTSDILAGLQHVLALTAFHAVASVNLSLGSDPQPIEADCDQASPSQRAAVAALANAGVATVAAAGNEYLTNAITSPACLSNVIGVGSVGDDDEVSEYSNSAFFLSLLAPGELVESAEVGGGTGFREGTSMASPHVAGAIAVIRDAVPGASVSEISNALALSGVPVLDTRNGITKPRISVPAAIALLQSAGASVSPVTSNGGNSGAGSASGGSSGGGGCGLVGLEPFLVLGLVRLGRRGRAAFGRRRLTSPACE